MSKIGQPRSHLLKHSSQAGAFAVEFALIFVIFFFILFVLLNIGMMFAAQQSINYAAQEAARSLSIYQNAEQPVDKCSSEQTFNSDTRASNEQRAQRAYSCALEQAQWIEDLAKSMNNTTDTIVEIAVCQRSGAVIAPRGNVSCAPYVDELKLNEVALVVQYNYSKHPMIPSLGVLNIYNFFTSGVTLANSQIIRTQTIWSDNSSYYAYSEATQVALLTQEQS